jgi:hypothetical protein
MEKVADTILFPCKYQTNGCLLNLMHKHKLEHEDCCDFRPVKDPFFFLLQSIDLYFKIVYVSMSGCIL